MLILVVDDERDVEVLFRQQLWDQRPLDDSERAVVFNREVLNESGRQNATVSMARIKFSSRCARQCSAASRLLVAYLPKSTVGMLRAALK
jgi:hypothetical protein